MESGRGGKRTGAGRPSLIPGEKAVSFGVKIPPSEAEMIRAAAEETGLSQARLIVEAVRAYMAARPPREI